MPSLLFIFILRQGLRSYTGWSWSCPAAQADLESRILCVLPFMHLGLQACTARSSQTRRISKRRPYFHIVREHWNKRKLDISRVFIKLRSDEKLSPGHAKCYLTLSSTDKTLWNVHNTSTSETLHTSGGCRAHSDGIKHIRIFFKK